MFSTQEIIAICNAIAVACIRLVGLEWIISNSEWWKQKVIQRRMHGRTLDKNETEVSDLVESLYDATGARVAHLRLSDRAIIELLAVQPAVRTSITDCVSVKSKGACWVEALRMHRQVIVGAKSMQQLVVRRDGGESPVEAGVPLLEVHAGALMRGLFISGFGHRVIVPTADRECRAITTNKEIVQLIKLDDTLYCHYSKLEGIPEGTLTGPQATEEVLQCSRELWINGATTDILTHLDRRLMYAEEAKPCEMVQSAAAKLLPVELHSGWVQARANEFAVWWFKHAGEAGVTDVASARRKLTTISVEGLSCSCNCNKSSVISGIHRLLDEKRVLSNAFCVETWPARMSVWMGADVAVPTDKPTIIHTLRGEQKVVGSSTCSAGHTHPVHLPRYVTRRQGGAIATEERGTAAGGRYYCMSHTRADEIPDSVKIELCHSFMDALGDSEAGLWSDVRCIPSGKQTEEIPKMRDYYRMCEMTIVVIPDSCLEPDKASLVLSALKASGSVAMPKRMGYDKAVVITMKNKDFMRVFSDAASSLARSKWVNRSWTLQEALLSRSLVFVTPGKLVISLADMIRLSFGDVHAGISTVMNDAERDGQRASMRSWMELAMLTFIGRYREMEKVDVQFQETAGFRVIGDLDIWCLRKPEWNMRQVLSSGHLRESTVPEDAIYGCLGLLEYGACVQIEYTDNIDTALHLVSKTAREHGDVSWCMWVGGRPTTMSADCMLPTIRDRPMLFDVNLRVRPSNQGRIKGVDLNVNIIGVVEKVVHLMDMPSEKDCTPSEYMMKCAEFVSSVHAMVGRRKWKKEDYKFMFSDGQLLEEFWLMDNKHTRYKHALSPSTWYRLIRQAMAGSLLHRGNRGAVEQACRDVSSGRGTGLHSLVRFK